MAGYKARLSQKGATVKSYIGPRGAVSAEPHFQQEVHLAAGLEGKTVVKVWNKEGTLRYQIKLVQLRALLEREGVESQCPSFVVADMGRRHIETPA